MGLGNLKKRFKAMKIDTLIKADWNYKTNDEKLSEKLAENIKRNGQIENIIVRKLETGFYEVETNETRFETDNLLLADRIREIIEAGETALDLSETMPYSEDEIIDYSELSDFDWGKFEETEETRAQEKLNQLIRLHFKITDELNSKWKEVIDEIRSEQPGIGSVPEDLLEAVLDRLLSNKDELVEDEQSERRR